MLQGWAWRSWELETGCGRGNLLARPPAQEIDRGTTSWRLRFAEVSSTLGDTGIAQDGNRTVPQVTLPRQPRQIRKQWRSTVF